MLFALLRSALWDREVDPAFFAGLSDETWRQVAILAKNQRVIAVAYDAVCKLPQDVKPPKMVDLVFQMETAEIEKRYTKQMEVMRDITQWFSTEPSIPFVVLKGASLARYYPVPAHRSSVDVDFYTGAGYEDSLKVLASKGVSFNTSHYKHAVLTWKGIPVENHHSFLSIKNYKTHRVAEQALKAELASAGFVSARLASADLVSPELSPIDWKVPCLPARASALFLLKHTLAHFLRDDEGATLRDLCDWALLLQKERASSDLVLSYLKENARAFGLGGFLDAWTVLAIDCLGLDARFGKRFTRSPRNEQRVLHRLLTQDAHALDNVTNPIRKRLLQTRQLFAHGWRFSLVGWSPWREFWRLGWRRVIIDTMNYVEK